jgi:two-component system, OmpR family, KDP operon response regulator KdpE
MNNDSPRILIVDNDPISVAALRQALAAVRIEYAQAGTSGEALLALRQKGFDAVILDVHAPEFGFETLRDIRMISAALPVLVLTQRDEEEEMVKAFDLGADDYVKKPFSARELMARIRAAVRYYRSSELERSEPIEIGGIRLAPNDRTVCKGGKVLHMTRTEFEVLHRLMSRAGQVITYRRLLTAVWGAKSSGEVQYLRNFIHQLRRKIEDTPSNPMYVLTDAQVGYHFATQEMFGDGKNDEQAAG